MKRRLAVAASLTLAALLAGCAASGPKFAEVAKTMPTIKPGEGRIYFFRSDSMFGAAMQPEIRLNNQVVGTSKPGGFFFVDRPAGTYVAAAATETEKTASFKLDAGETKYLRTSPSMGVMVGRIVIEIEDAAKARGEIETLSYTGGTTAAK
jgi:hypothetical protein